MCVTLDTFGNIYSVGSFGGTVDFDPGVGVYNLTAGLTDIFISKLDPTGNFVWAKSAKSSNTSGNLAYAVITGSIGN